MQRGPLRAVARALAAAACGVVVALTCLVLPASAAGASLDCTPMGDPACRNLVPTVACQWANPDGSHTVVFGYANPATITIHIDPGSHNGIAPGASDQGQPQDFPPGVVANDFVITTPAGVWPSWRLGNTTAYSSSSTLSCPGNPVPMVGSLVALGLGLAVILMVLLAALLAHPRAEVAVPRPRAVWS